MTIKDKILLFLEEMKIKKADFFLKTGIAPSNFKGVAMNSELGGDKIVKILTEYPDLSAEWLLLGKGAMFRDELPSQKTEESLVTSTRLSDDSFIYKMYKEKDEENRALIRENGRLEERIQTLESKLQEYQSALELNIEHPEDLSNAKDAFIKKRSSQINPNVGSVIVPSKDL
nr:MAG TPA: CI repressor [Caudoviricetes sp.]